jgi:hypothetical protein
MKITYRRREGKVADDAIAKHIPYELPNFSIEQLKKEYEQLGINLTQAELETKRKAFDFLHETIYLTITNNKKLHENEQSDFIHQSEYRRAS